MDTGYSRTVRLLFVDDEVSFVEVMAKRLGKRNIEVTGVNSGTEALRVFRHQDFDLALLDLKMEDMDGIELLKIFKKMDPDLPVIMLTGHGSEQAAEEGMKHGASDYLAKPCDIKVLTGKILALARREEVAT